MLCGKHSLCLDRLHARSRGDTADETIGSRIIRYDETTGAQSNQQVDFPAANAKPSPTPISLPWQTWSHHNNTGLKEADRAAADAALHNLHEHADYAEPGVDMVSWGDRTSVVASRAVAKSEVNHPPCAPVQSKVHDKTDHPFSVNINLTVMHTAQDAVGADNAVARRTSFYILPEFNYPARQDPTNAGTPQEWACSETGVETMQPFWAVRRLTRKQLECEQDKTKIGGLRLQLNCELTVQPVSVVCVATMNGSVCSRMRIFDISSLTHTLPLGQGEELILEVNEKARQERPTAERTWRDAEADKAKAEKANTADKKQK